MPTMSDEPLRSIVLCRNIDAGFSPQEIHAEGTRDLPTRNTAGQIDDAYSPRDAYADTGDKSACNLKYTRNTDASLFTASSTHADN